MNTLAFPFLFLRNIFNTNFSLSTNVYIVPNKIHILSLSFSTQSILQTTDFVMPTSVLSIEAFPLWINLAMVWAFYIKFILLFHSGCWTHEVYLLALISLNFTSQLSNLSNLILLLAIKLWHSIHRSPRVDLILLTNNSKCELFLGIKDFHLEHHHFKVKKDFNKMLPALVQHM